MRVFIVTSGEWSDYGIVGVAATQEEAVVICEKADWPPIQIELFDDDQCLAIWKYQKGGFAEGQLKLKWEKKKQQ